jgi:dihydroflavonol-4-reductase
VSKEAELCTGDLCDPQSLEHFFAIREGMESIVIHCASMVTVNHDFNQKLIDINVGGTKNIINKCLRHKECRKLVYVSSTGAIPELPKGQNIKEKEPLWHLLPFFPFLCHYYSIFDVIKQVY